VAPYLSCTNEHDPPYQAALYLNFPLPDANSVPDDARFGTMRIYGECRNMADHRNDNPAWKDITDQLS
jgi:hypothetical protein